MAPMSDSERVLSYWLEPKPETEEAMAREGRRWFMGGAEVDAEIHERFGPLVAAARAGELDGFAETARGRLALIILIDQFSRNLYRSNPDAFAADAKARALAREGYDSGLFAEFDSLDHLFAGMPFSHSENLDDQRRAVALTERAAMAAKPVWRGFFTGAVEFARKHLDVIARFGRFPHRNAVLGRASTSEEEAYLAYCKFAGTWL
jgi:uncharacterized protein (DUF924 family)